MTKRGYRLFIEDMLDSMIQIEEYIHGLDRADFSADKKTIDAVIRNIEIIGEAARNVPENIRNNHPGIPWKQMIGLRNLTIHAYFGIDLDIIWQIASVNIPETKSEIARILDSLDAQT